MLTLYLEINNTNYIFFVGNSDEQNNFKIVYKLEVPLKGIEDNRISDLENVYLTLKENIYLIEDCAEALGSKYKKRLVGLDGDCSCHSFFANKTITTGEGGMVVFKKKSHAKKASIVKNHGMSIFKRYLQQNK